MSTKFDIIVESGVKTKTSVINTYDFQVKRMHKIKNDVETIQKQLHSVLETNVNKVKTLSYTAFKYIDQVLENKYIKLATEPVLNLTQLSIDYVLPNNNQSKIIMI